MEAPVEGAVEEWQEGMEAAGPLPLQTLEVRATPFPHDRDVRPRPPSRDAPIEAPLARCCFADAAPPPPPAQEHGVAASDIKKLLEAGIHTVEGLAHASKKSLKDIKGLSEMKVEKLKPQVSLKLADPSQNFFLPRSKLTPLSRFSLLSQP